MVVNDSVPGVTTVSDPSCGANVVIASAVRPVFITSRNCGVKVDNDSDAVVGVTAVSNPTDGANVLIVNEIG